MFIYNVHAPSKTFALAAKENETADALIDRILAKARLSTADTKAVRSNEDGAGVVYEFDGDRWSLEDDDDLAIVTARFKAEPLSNQTPSITLHVVQPGGTANGHVQPPPPAYASASAQVQARAQKKSTKTRSGGTSHAAADSPAVNNVNTSAINSPTSRRSGAAAGTRVHPAVDRLTASTSLCIPNAAKNGARSVRSMRSNVSRRSKWGDDDAEPLGDVKRREFEAFHAGNGVRTVVGKVGNVQNVRMLLKGGHRHIYLSRVFAIRHGLIPKKHAPGLGAYTGLKILGNVPITVGSRTSHHNVMLSEEQHFDVVLGRSWVEKMNIKVDPLDPTLLTYMDTGETIPCDLVVLRDAKGEVITIT